VTPVAWSTLLGTPREPSVADCDGSIATPVASHADLAARRLGYDRVEALHEIYRGEMTVREQCDA